MNKNILREVKSMRRDFYTIWLDYKKVFDSIPHNWLIGALKSAKVPKHLITAIENLIKPCIRKLQHNNKNEFITSYLIEIMKGI